MKYQASIFLHVEGQASIEIARCVAEGDAVHMARGLARAHKKSTSILVRDRKGRLVTLNHGCVEDVRDDDDILCPPAR